MESVSQVVSDIQERKSKREEIRATINELCQRKYGIEDFFSLVDSFLPAEDGFAMCLARQVPTINVEHIGCHLLAEWLSSTMEMPVTTLPLSLAGDSYTAVNSYKKSLVKLPWLARARSEQLFVNNQIIARGNLEGSVLGSIETTSGDNLLEHHSALRELVLGPNNVAELSPFFERLLAESLQKGKGPKMAYQAVLGHANLVHARVGMKNLRPHADWAYQFHAMLFLDGKRALLSTVGDNDEVVGWFARANQGVKEVTGLLPLIIDTPVEVQVGSYKSNLLEYPTSVMDNNWREKINMPQIDSSLSIFQVTEKLEKEVIVLQ